MLESPEDISTTDTGESRDYLTRGLITYIGNKRALLGPIGEAVAIVRAALGGRRLDIFDAFSGSGAVARFLKAHARLLVTNDLEDYAAVVARSALANASSVDEPALRDAVDRLNAAVDRAEPVPGIIADLYAPADDTRIAAGERVFYTRANALRLDEYRRRIAQESPLLQDHLLAALLAKASVHANTAGVFKGFYKDRRTRLGQFGGTGRDALSRILRSVRLECPVFSRFECATAVHQGDSNLLAPSLPAFDLVYLDPPYNQHPYGSNYFMLNLLVRYERPASVSRISGIPTDWRRSGYNARARSFDLFRELVSALNTRFLLVSFNDEGFIPPSRMRDFLQTLGRLTILETRYNAFRGSRNLMSRPVHVTESLFLVERQA